MKPWRLHPPAWSRHHDTMLHLIKLAVGVPDLDHLRQWQAERARQDPPLRHRTRNAPRRAAEILDGGSIYWVIARVLCVRQRILDITEGTWKGGESCAELHLDANLVPVQARAHKPFQGWRYLAPADAPPDVDSGIAAIGADQMPEKMRRELEMLGLL